MGGARLRGGKVREIRGTVVRLARPARGAATGPARQAVTVGHGRHREDLRVGGRHVGLAREVEVPPLVSGGDDEVHPGRGGVAYRLVLGIAGRAAAADRVAGAAEAHVRHLDPKARGVGGHPVDATDHRGGRARAAGVEDLHRVGLGARRHSHHAGAVVAGGDRARHVGSVTLVVLSGGAWRDAIGAVGGIEVGVVEVDPGVDHGHVRTAGLPGRGRGPGEHPPYAERGGVAGGQWNEAGSPHAPVGRYVGDLGVVAQAADLLGRERGREALDGAAEAAVAVEAQASFARGGLGRGIGHGALVDDDVGVVYLLGRGSGGNQARDDGRRRPSAQESPTPHHRFFPYRVKSMEVESDRLRRP